jgi:hypothetical protein
MGGTVVAVHLSLEMFEAHYRIYEGELMPKAQDCFFLLTGDESTPDEKRRISPLCLTCRQEHFPHAGWFWKGSTDGYGPYDYKCCHCGDMIYKGKRPKKQKKLEG